jgi:hypothetical protein
MKIEINFSIDTEKDKQEAEELLEILKALKELIQDLKYDDV